VFDKPLKCSFLIASVIAFGGITLTPPLMAMDVLDIDKTFESENFRSRGGKKPTVLILHCVGLSYEWVKQNYGFTKENGGLGVSAHYYISQESNKTYQFVSEKNSAFHAGVSEWRGLAKQNGLQGLNDMSVGIEFQSSGYGQVEGKGYYPYSFGSYDERQMDFGKVLCQKIMKEYNISPENVVWHSDVSPLRMDSGKISFGKTDPGPHFPAESFARSGIGVWPSSIRLEDSLLDTSLVSIQEALKAWGYPHIEPTGVFDEETKYVLTSHYMHYLPKEVPCWDDFKNQQNGSIFDTVKKWEEFPYDKEKLFISLENLTKKHFVLNLQ